MAGIFSGFALSVWLLDIDFLGHRDRISQAGHVWTGSILYPLSQLVVMDLKLLCWRPLAFQRLLSWSFSLLMALRGLERERDGCFLLLKAIGSLRPSFNILHFCQ
ncbi:hypothetical protein TNCT_263271 [Trichonephila clavata]|uniref:Uncharacterized protein n=1 Tax=Trichonephila clavata TaxID=2740835 RepID=A0A8X6IF72_TRICU|nr:hypothetical protein TNCT_263271 [Trichonephila clavata]